MGVDFDCNEIIGGLLALMAIGLPTFYGTRYYAIKDSYKEKLPSFRGIYETYREQEIWDILTEYTDHIHKKIIDKKINDLKGMTIEEISMDYVIGTLERSDIDPESLIYRTLDDDPFNARIEKYERQLKDSFKSYFEIEVLKDKAIELSQKIALRIFIIPILLFIIILLYLIYKIFGVTDLNVIAIFISIEVFLGLNILNLIKEIHLKDIKEFNEIEKKYVDAFEKYPPSS